MAHRRKKKALYEVIGKTSLKSDYDESLQRLQPKPAAKIEPSGSDSVVSEPQQVSGWPKRPKMIQFNAGRIEISMPYQLAVVIFLSVVLLLLVSYRLGQNNPPPPDVIADAPESLLETLGPIVFKDAQKPGAYEVILPEAGATASVISTGNNRIVIKTYDRRAHLEPVKQYFAQNDIETEIIMVNDTYFLVTMNKYENPQRAGTDGYAAKQRIIELGAGYKAPPGYETFGTKPFDDAYGMRFND